MSTKIDNLVEQSTIDNVKRLSDELSALLVTYTNVAKDLAKGIEMPVKTVGDLEKLENLLVEKGQQAVDVNKQLNNVISQQREVMGNTSNTISRQLMEREKLNKAQREEYTGNERVKQLLEHLHDTYDNQVKRMVQLQESIKRTSKEMKANEKDFSMGRVSMEQFMSRQSELIAQHRALTQEKRTLGQIMTAEEKMNQSTETSYAYMSQQLELLRKAHKELSDEGVDSPYGKELGKTIQELDAHLKDLAADMGEFQRNVGNYAIACQNGVASTEDLNRVLDLNAATIDGCIEQNKALEKAKAQLDQSDDKYAETLDKINRKIEENKARIMDVSDIMGKVPTTVEEAEEQNKRLAAALKLVDLHADGAADTIREYKEQIDSNNKIIKSVSDTTDDYTESILSAVGANGNFGKSLQSLANGGAHGFIDGLNTKAKALGKTLIGLVANPVMLAILGVGGVVAGVKWWYSYNKGLVEATKLTKDFSGLSGGALKSVRSEVQAVADKYNKDFREVLESANAMSKQFGISFQESVKLIGNGFTLGADSTGEFLENVKEYPAYFKEAGISASEFVAITTQANKAGIYSDKGIDVIKEGNLRIREMTKSTAAALDAIGISSKEVQKSLTDGSKTTFDIMQEVSAKLAEFPESSSEVGAALADIFGGPGEDAGLQYILTLKDIETNIDTLKDKGGELADIEAQELRSQAELNKVLASAFDSTGGSFERMTGSAKIFVNDGLVKIIKGCVDIANWFIEMYNGSILVRGSISSIGNAFNITWDVMKLIFNQIFDALKALARVVKGVFTLDWDEVADGWEYGLRSMKENVITAAKNIAQDTADAFNDTVNGKLKPIDISAHAELDIVKDKSKYKPGPTGGYTPKESDEEKKAREKAAKEELKRLHELEESKLAIMADGHEKDLAMIRLNYKKKLDEITGNSQTEQELRIQLAEQCEKEVADCELNYQKALSKINLENRLATVKKGSKEELDLRLAQVERERSEEIKEAEKTGADLELIQKKHNKRRLDIENEYHEKRLEAIRDQYAEEQGERDMEMMAEQLKLEQKYVKELKLVGNNEAKRAQLTAQYEAKSADISNKYAIQTAQSTVEMLEKSLAEEGLSVEERKRLSNDLAKAKMAVAEAITKKEIDEIKRRTAAEKEAQEERKEIARQTLQTVSDSLNASHALFSALNDAKIQKIEEEQEANDEAAERDQERISELVEQGVITEEEGEARKRAAEEASAKKSEELEKKKAALKHRQAVWDRTNSIAQAAIATALAITQALPNLVLAAIAATMGAAQIATIIATPIPKYAKGTDYHKGGPAIVGDGGRPELVMFDKMAWITPDTPTLVELPAGATVLPDISGRDGLVPPIREAVERPTVIVNNDYSRLERAISEVAMLIKAQTKAQKKAAYDAEFERYKNSKM